MHNGFMTVASRSPATGTLGDFLRSRRAKLDIDELGLPSYGRRRVPGLRREELAQLAGVSPTYYTRLEQGVSQNASDSVIAALARALKLDDDEQAHLFALARTRPTAKAAPIPAEQPSQRAKRLLDAMPGVPGLLLGRTFDVLAWNRAGHALLAGHLDYNAPGSPETRPNQMRQLFLDPHTRELHRDWPHEALLAVASFRFQVAELPADPRAAALIGELSLASPEFARLWAEQPVRMCASGVKRLHHPEVGDIDLDFDVLHLPGGTGQRLLTMTACPGTPSEAALRLLQT
jgi:transcriptional regulator with XRE-family HTH domain